MYYRSWGLVVQLTPLNVFKENVHSLNPPLQLLNLLFFLYVHVYHSLFFFFFLVQLPRD